MLFNSPRFWVLLSLVSCSSFPLFAQKALRLFTDCSCNQTLLRQRLDYVDHTTDPATAQVHLFINTQWLPQGGRIYRLDFSEVNKAAQSEGKANHISFEFSVPATHTAAEIDEQLTHRIELGLLSFLAGSSYADLVSIKINKEAAGSTASSAAEESDEDPWRSWIFEVYSSVAFSKESLRKTSDIRAGLRIEKVKPEIRIRISPFYSYWSRVFTTEDGEDLLSFRERARLSASVVKSISDHWSVGLFGSGEHHSFININAGYWIAPAIEYSFFNYNEVPFKEFTAAYRVGMVYNDYLQETVLLQEQEALARHILNVDLRLRQKWGNVFAGLTAGSYLHDPSLNRLSFSSRFDVRIVKGLSVNFSGNYQLINDQINLPRGEASLEDILLGQTQLATNFDAEVRLGFSYTFGSIYNNVVNTRL